MFYGNTILFIHNGERKKKENIMRMNSRFKYISTLIYSFNFRKPIEIECAQTTEPL